MKTYDIFVQDKLFKNFESDAGYSIRDIATEIDAAIASGELEVDRNQPVGIRVVPKN